MLDLLYRVLILRLASHLARLDQGTHMLSKVKTIVAAGVMATAALASVPVYADTVTFTLPGFSVIRRQGIDLPVGFTATVNADMTTTTTTRRAGGRGRASRARK